MTPNLFAIVALAVGAADGGADFGPADAGGTERELTAAELREARLNCYGRERPDKKPVSQAIWRVWLSDGKSALTRGGAAEGRDLLVKVVQRGSENPDAVRLLILAHRSLGMGERARGCELLSGYLARHPPKSMSRLKEPGTRRGGGKPDGGSP